MGENRHTMTDLYQMQSLPLSAKIAMTKSRIRAWYEHFDGDVYVSFSGGKDSTVLLHLVRELYKDVPAVFFDTGLEYPEIREFVKTFDNVEWIKPKMTFKEVVNKYGYPIISKEVAECVYGARKYLRKVLTDYNEGENILQTDRQTDRQTDAPYRYRYERLCGLGEFASARGGGYGNKIPYSHQWDRLTNSEYGKELKPQNEQGSGGGGAVRRFCQLTGILTTDNSIDTRLYKDYRQFQNTTSDEHSSGGEEIKSDSGEHP